MQASCQGSFEGAPEGGQHCAAEVVLDHSSHSRRLASVSNAGQVYAVSLTACTGAGQLLICLSLRALIHGQPPPIHLHA